jgi:hypothetical protein
MIGDFDMKLTQKLLGHYKRASKKTKGLILTEYCQLTETSRNTASKRFRKQIRNVYPRVLSSKATAKRRGPKKSFSSVHMRIVKKCWELAGGICAERLHPMLCAYIDQLEIRGMLGAYSKGDISAAKSISVATLKRVISSFPKTSTKKHKGNAMIYKQVPIVANFGEFTDEPGFVEVDYVEHNGGTSSGLFAITGTYTDIFSGWTARAAGLGKNLSSVSSIDKIVHSRIVHPVVHYHPDNDKTILRILFDKQMKDNNNKQGKPPFALSRSRPYKKNDNAHVEQKNDDKVRKLVGYCRYDTQDELELLNLLYEKADMLDNFFIPSAKLMEKIRDDKGRVIRRVHDKPKTPYRRLIECKRISDKIKQKLSSIYNSLDMIELRQQINKILQKLYEIQLIRSRKINMS